MQLHTPETQSHRIEIAVLLVAITVLCLLVGIAVYMAAQLATAERHEGTEQPQVVSRSLDSIAQPGSESLPLRQVEAR